MGFVDSSSWRRGSERHFDGHLWAHSATTVCSCRAEPTPHVSEPSSAEPAAEPSVTVIVGCHFLLVVTPGPEHGHALRAAGCGCGGGRRGRAAAGLRAGRALVPLEVSGGGAAAASAVVAARSSWVCQSAVSEDPCVDMMGTPGNLMMTIKVPMESSDRGAPQGFKGAHLDMKTGRESGRRHRRAGRKILLRTVANPTTVARASED